MERLRSWGVWPGAMLRDVRMGRCSTAAWPAKSIGVLAECGTDGNEAGAIDMIADEAEAGHAG